ncbi:hypothetical protein [Celeribacter marinus]|uniref:hypothetical protein n=1 Tax=Celeribacter marinus TaxID=1397108 RepID=UPI0031822BC8
MKPNFALNLSHDGIALLHRGPDGWYAMGEVALDDPDMGGALDALRALATSISPKGLTTKLVIPNSQILYRTIPDPLATTPSATKADRIRAIHASLEGATPYALDELVWDWRASQGSIQIAVVARDTLAEADAFAVEHRFNPISYVALAESGTFSGEPFFGRASTADAVIGAETEIEPDSDAIVVRAGRPPQPQLETPETSDDGDKADHESAATPDTALTDTAQADTAQADQEVAHDDAPSAQSEPDTAEPPSDVKEDDPAKDDDAAQPTAPRPLSAFRSHRDANAADHSVSDGNTTERLRAQASRLFAAAQDDDEPQTPKAQDKPHVAVTAPTLPGFETAPIAPAKPAPKVKRSAPLPEPAPMPAPTRGISKLPSAPATSPASATPPLSVATQKAQAHRDAPLDKTPPPTPATPHVVTQVSGGFGHTGEPSIADISDVAHIAPVAEPEPDRDPSRLALTARALARSAGLAVSNALGKARTRKEQRQSARRAKAEDAATRAAPQPEAAPLPVQDATTEAEALTVFGARRRNHEQRGKPRYMGLILTVVLLAILGAVYIWASFLPDTTQEPQTGALDVPPVQTTTTVVADDLSDAPVPPAPFDEGVDATGEADADIADAAIPELATDALPAPLGQDTQRLSLKDVQDHYATTGVWAAAPQAGTANDTDVIDDLYIASIDPQILSQDAIALPDARLHTAEDLPRPTLTPVPSNTTFNLDARGLVIATPEGALSPEGVMVFAGRPAVVTPARPERAPAAPIVIDDNDPVRVALKAYVPQPRPDLLVENNERANLGGITRAQLAAFRPAARPASPQQEAQEDAEAVGEPAPEATAPLVVTSIVPSARPANIEKLAAAARAAAAAAATATEQDTTTNSTATRVTAKVPATTVPRSAPTSVANAATVKNQLNLRQLNLMGVYGSSSDRRALLRLPSGRFAKVKVGDSVNGGRVQSITSDALTYVKSGRSTTLKVGG